MRSRPLACSIRSHDERIAGSRPVMRPRVLVVDDDPHVRRVLCRAFAAELDTVEAVDGEDGITKAIAMLPDLIVTDMSMPRKSGEELVLTLRARAELAFVPIILLSADGDESSRIRLLQGGAQDYVLKPFSAEEVLVRARNLIAMNR